MVVSNIRTAANFKQTVLIIDDQPTVLAIHAAIIKSLKLNLNIVTMTNPVDALAWMHNRQVDLMVTDFKMTHMNGMQLIEAINQTNSVKNMPIVVISVLKDTKLYKELMAAGATACLTKPASATDLSNMARLLLEQSKALYNNKQVATH